MSVASFIEKGWTQGYFARDSNGMICEHYEPQAVSWCIIGAIRAEYPNDFSQRQKCYNKLENILGSGLSSVVEFNDNPKRTKEEVLDLIRKAGI